MAFDFSTMRPMTEKGIDKTFDFSTLAPVGRKEDASKPVNEVTGPETFPVPEPAQIERQSLSEPSLIPSEEERFAALDAAVAEEDAFLSSQRNRSEIESLMEQLRGKIKGESFMSRMIDKTLAKNVERPESVAEFWGKVYQSESDPKKMKQFVKHQDIDLVEGVEPALNKALKVFEGDKGTNNKKLKSVMVAIAKHESKGGKLLVQGKGGPARGAWQVEPATALDVIRTSGLIGPKAEKLLKKTKQEILDMSEEELATWLKDHTVSAVFATAKTLQAADAKKMLGFLI